MGKRLPGEDVVRHGGERVLVAQGEAEGEHQGGLAGSDGSVGVRDGDAKC